MESNPKNPWATPNSGSSLSDLINDANHATHAEKTMTIYQAFKAYPKAVMFSIILSTAIVMEAYDG